MTEARDQGLKISDGYKRRNHSFYLNIMGENKTLE